VPAAGQVVKPWYQQWWGIIVLAILSMSAGYVMLAVLSNWFA
jgi:hypothetical protein